MSTTKNAKGVANLLVRAVEAVYNEDAVEGKLQELYEMFEEAMMDLEIRREEDELEHTHRDEDDADWYNDLASNLEDRIEAGREVREKKEKLKKFKGFAHVVGL